MRLREADITIPKIELKEPLRLQAEAFIRRLQEGELTLSEAEKGLLMMRSLHAIDLSLKQDGKRIRLSEI